jgi:TolB protein
MAADSSVARSSPVGGLIAYVGGPSKSSEIYVIKADGTGRRQRTHSPESEWCPAWSPNGKRIAVTVVKSAQRRWVEVLTGEGKRLWRVPGITCSGWSPDGSRILLARGDVVYLADADGRNPRKLKLPNLGSWPVWSPDGKEIAYVMAQDDTDNDPTDELTIIVASVDGAGRRSLHVRAPSWCTSYCRLYAAFFVWAPGKDIAFVLVQGDLYPERLYAIHPDGSGQRLLSGRLDDIYWPAWSPDGKRIAFVYRRGSHDQIWIAKANGSGIRQATRIRSHTSNLSGCYDPVWSPDTTRLLCFGWAGGMYVADTASGTARLLVRDARTSEEFEPPASWQPLP